MRIYLLLSILLLGWTFSFTQQVIRTVNYSTTNGMISDVTYSGIFDKRNYLWICTDRGLSRFDGTDFTHFTISEGLPDNDVIHVTEDDEGTIWAQPFQREVAFLEINKSVFTNVNTIIHPDTVSKDVAYKVFKLQNGAVGLLTPKGVIRVIQKKKWIKSYRLPYETIIWNTFIYENKQQQIIVISSQTTVIFEKSGHYSKKSNPFDITRSEMHGEKAIFHKTGNNTITLVDPSSEKTSTMNIGANVHRFGMYSNGILTGDVERNISFTEFTSGKTKQDSLKALVAHATENADKSIQVIFTADEGIFVRTFPVQYQYHYLNKTPYYFYLNQNTVNAVDGHGNIIYPKTPASHIRIHKNSPAIPIFGEYNNDTEIIYSALIMTLHGKKYKDYANNPMGGIKDIYILNDSIRYLATHSGIYEYNIKKLTSRYLYKGRTTAVTADPNGSVFIGTHWGLIELKKDGTLHEWTKEGHFPNIRVVDLLYRNQVLWIATAGKGLMAICNGKVTTVLSESNGLSKNFITALGEAYNQQLYIGYYDGAQKLIYTVQNDVPVIEQLVILETYKGEGIKSFFQWKTYIYALGNRGIFVFDTRKTEPLKQFKLRVTRIVINNKLKEVTGNYNLQPGDYDFLIYFSTINFEQFPLRYRYRINNGKWNYTSDTKIRYKNLSHGKYNVEIQVLNNYCKPSDTSIITFDVNPPFVKTSGFIFSVIAASIILIVLLISYWFRRKYRKESERLIQENKLNELELIALKAQINPHFVFNCLNSIKGLIYENDLEEADKYIDRFAQLFRNTLEASFSSFHPVTTEIAYLTTYLEMEQVSMKNRFSFIINTINFPNPYTLFVPPMLLQPYVENAVKHGIGSLRERKGEIIISFEHKDNTLICKIADNGLGIKSNGKEHLFHHGKGISITNRRAQLYKIKTQITDNVPSGTIVLVIIPIDIINSIKQKNDKSIHS